MPVVQWLYLPIAEDSDINFLPTIEHDAETIAAMVRESMGDQPQNEDDAEEDDDDGGYGRYGGGNQNRGVSKAMDKVHEKRPGWVPILAWSHGYSSSGRGKGNMQDLSLTKWYDYTSPLETVMVMRSEVVPAALLRIMYMPKKGKFKVIEQVLKNVVIDSLSTGGSGGEDRLTENITMSFTNISIRHIAVSVNDGSILEDFQGVWDDENNKGSRKGNYTLPTLQALAKNVVNRHISIYGTRDLAAIPKNILATLDIDVNSVHPIIPLKGRKYFVTNELPQDDIIEKLHFKEIYLKDLTYAALVQVISARFNTTPDKVERIYQLYGRCMVEMENNDQVWSMTEDTMLFAVLKN
eukprot:TRINITY_DN11456_c0_g1_i1.p1 TRINITY_DN11456_c0_g1~~TRINITY_DN11456_c0_g1_i1.p1  ORF type:complete len:352 (+),score=86.84 TRINITY_DN11456_c0_g1_i1:97-1152(+)